MTVSVLVAPATSRTTVFVMIESAAAVPELPDEVKGSGDYAGRGLAVD